MPYEVFGAPIDGSFKKFYLSLWINLDQLYMAARAGSKATQVTTRVGRLKTGLLRDHQVVSSQEWLDTELRLAENRQEQGVLISRPAAYRLVQECMKQNNLEFVRRLQVLIGQSGLASVPVFAYHLIRLFDMCASLAEAKKAFSQVRKPSSYTWRAIIDAHVKHGEKGNAIKLYEKMKSQGMKPTKFLFPNILKACEDTGAIDQGRSIHKQIIEYGFQHDNSVGTALIYMYDGLGCLDDAFKVFNDLPNRDVFAWCAMINACAHHGKDHLALECFKDMQCNGLKPKEYTFSCVLKACGSIGAIKQGRRIHEQVVNCGFLSNIFVGTSIVIMYAELGIMKDARDVFDKLPIRGYASWDALIAGYVENNEGIRALECFETMQIEGISPTSHTYCSALKACSSLGAIEQGRRIHMQCMKRRIQTSIVLGNTLVVMYTSCYDLEKARIVFDNMPNRDAMSWGAMITGYAQLGETGLALQCFQEMQQCHIPDAMAFSGMLIAFKRAGLVDEGLRCFTTINMKRDIKPNFFHITCMVDTVGRAGCFREAEDLLKVARQPDIPIWKALLSACRMHGNVKLGKHCFDKMICLDSCCAAAYCLMTNIYVSAHMKEKVLEVQTLGNKDMEAGKT